MLKSHKCDSCKYRETLLNHLVGCSKKRKIIWNSGDNDNCEDYQQQLVDFDTFKNIFGKVGVAY